MDDSAAHALTNLGRQRAQLIRRRSELLLLRSGNASELHHLAPALDFGIDETLLSIRRRAINRDLIENQIRGLLKNLGLVIGQAKMNVFAVRAAELADNRPSLTAVIEPLLKAREAVTPHCDQHDKSEDYLMTLKWLMAGGVAALIVSSPSFAQDKASQKFLKEAIEGNLAEVKMGELAQKNGNSDKVRSFGQMLQKDHSEANQKATTAANQLGVSPPTEPNSKQKAMYDRMSKLSADKFDREFAKDMVEDHKKNIKTYEKEAKKNDAAGAYAKETLPSLHKHLETAQSLTGTATVGKR
jgi:putative membrane protein